MGGGGAGLSWYSILFSYLLLYLSFRCTLCERETDLEPSREADRFAHGRTTVPRGTGSSSPWLSSPSFFFPQASTQRPQILSSGGCLDTGAQSQSPSPSRPARALLRGPPRPPPRPSEPPPLVLPSAATPGSARRPPTAPTARHRRAERSRRTAPGTGEPLTTAEARRGPTDGGERARRAARAAIR